MIDKILRKLNFLKYLFRDSSSSFGGEGFELPLEMDKSQYELSSSLQQNCEDLRAILRDYTDLNIRRFSVGETGVKAAIGSIDGLSNKELLSRGVVAPVMEGKNLEGDEPVTLERVQENVVSTGTADAVGYMERVVDAILSGEAVLFIDGESQALVLGTRGWEMRQIDMPQTEAVVRGPREGFTETLRVNSSMIRRRVQNPDLKMESMKLGRRTRTEVIVTYIDGIASDEIVEEVKRRLRRIDTDGILESGYINEFIDDHPFSPFPTINQTESPDTLVGRMLDGRVGILVDGTPFALTIPMLFFETFMSKEDYYMYWFGTSVVRLLRFLGGHITLFAPALFVAVTTFHPAVIPVGLLITLAATREGVPFPPAVTAFVLGVAFEVLREAGVRLPRPVGQTVSIVGALIIGDAAVRAGLVSTPLVVIVALTAITSFLIPPQMEGVMFLRLPILVAAAFLGLYGIVWSYAFLVIHVASLRSFGVPYMYPLMPFNFHDLKDVPIRLPWWMMRQRPRGTGVQDISRQSPNMKPGPGRGSSRTKDREKGWDDDDGQ